MDAYINHISYYLPKLSLDNAQISSEHPEWSIEKIASKTGIHNRHISSNEEFSSDMAVDACNILFSEFSEIKKEDIDYLILCTQSPDYFLPSTSCIIQDKLGLQKHVGAIDVNQGCSGFIYSLGLAKGLICSGQAKNILVVTSETYSKFINASDKSNKTLFGDAAAAILVSYNNIGIRAKIENFVYGTDGSGYEGLIVKNGGMKNRFAVGTDIFENEVFIKNDNNLFMDGRAVFQFTSLVVPKLVEDTLISNKLDLEDVDWFVFHQANKFMLDKIRSRIGIDESKFIFNSENVGNTVSSTIPISLKNLLMKNEFNKGDKIMLAGFGVGLSYGSTLISIS
jgi:3-oxoacyl-[acyl-carrier-protein] synthase-3